MTAYCAVGSPHDRYFFRRSEQMVAGAVSPPRLELANEDLVRAHVHAVWLAETGVPLGRSMRDVLDLNAEGYPLATRLLGAVNDTAAARRAARRAQALLESIAEDLGEAGWYRPGWLAEEVAKIGLRLDTACDRWRSLYRAASQQLEDQHRVRQDPSASQAEKRRAKRRYDEAEAQRGLLTADETSTSQSDFYPYRYLASESFLPGYSFPRLPLSAYVPGRRDRNEYLSRPRFLAISEFEPGALVYHEGARYQIERVVIPPTDAGEGGTLPLSAAKQCKACGLIHPYDGASGRDVCERCKAELHELLPNLFRMQNVITRRRERINSDEEERQRKGFELRTGMRFTGLTARSPPRPAPAAGTVPWPGSPTATPRRSGGSTWGGGAGPSQSGTATCSTWRPAGGCPRTRWTKATTRCPRSRTPAGPSGWCPTSRTPATAWSSSRPRRCQRPSRRR